jgi:hypothetical protein
METFEHNKLLKSIKTLYDIYSIRENFLDVTCLFKILFEKKIVDIKKVDIFQISYFIKQHLMRQGVLELDESENQRINEEDLEKEDESNIGHKQSLPSRSEIAKEKDSFRLKPILFKDFLSIIFYILIRHLQEENNYDNNDSIENLSKCLDDEMDLEEVLCDPQIMSNVVSYRDPNQKEKNDIKYSSINIIQCIMSQENISYSYCYPNFNKSHVADFIDNIETIQEFNDEIYTLFKKYASYDADLNCEYILFTDIVSIISEKNIFANNSSKIISELLSTYIPCPFDYLNEEFTNIFDDPKISKNKNLIEMQLAKFNLSNFELKFNFSTFSFFITHFHRYLKANEGKSVKDSILYYYKVVLEFDVDRVKNKYNESKKANSVYEEPIDDEEDEFAKLLKVENFPPSIYLEEAKKMEFKHDEVDEGFLMEFLSSLDKELPIVPIYNTTKNVENGFSLSSTNKIKDVVNINQLINDIEALDTNNLYSGKTGKLKFPFNTLKSELDNEILRKTDLKEKKMIEKAKKPVKNNNKKEAPAKPLDFEPLPIKKKTDAPELEPKQLQKRYFSNTIRELIVNSYVYPSIISESLMIPHKIPNEIKKLIIVALRNIIKGEFNLGLSQLERAQYEISDIKLNDPQTDLYFNITFGNTFMNMNLFSMAIKFFYSAKTISYSMSTGNPDVCLVFCYIGDLMLRMNEPEWALRSYWKAKILRESIIGGDTLDTATVYNNLGVCFYYLKKYYETFCFFKLAYAIYKEYE